jgi:MFS family permease
MAEEVDPAARSDSNQDVTEKGASKVDALRHRGFRLLWSGQTASVLGNQMLPVALAILVLRRGMGATGLGLVLGVQALAMGAGTLICGAIGDRWPRTRIMIGSDIVRACAVVVIAVDPVHLPVAMLYVLVVLLGIGEGMFQPAFNAVIPRLVPESLLLPANVLNGLSVQVAMLAGPALSGAIIALGSTSLVFWIDAATFAASLGTLARIKEPHVVAAETATGARNKVFRQIAEDFTEGIRAVRSRPWIMAVILLATVIMTLVVAPAYVLLPVIARARLGGAPAYGVVMAALGLGSIVGSLVVGRIRSRHPGVVALVGLFTVAGSVTALATLPLVGVIAFWALAGVGVTIFQVIWITALQKDVPGNVMTRVMALDLLGSQAGMPIGYAITGPIAAALGDKTVLIAGAVLVLVTVPLPLLARGGAVFSTPAALSPAPAGSAS